MGGVASILLTRRPGGSIDAAGELSASFGRRVPLADGTSDGIYGGWRWDGSALAIAADRYGLYPLFAWASRDRLVLSSDLLALVELGAPTTLDDDALAVFVRAGFFLGDDTPFAAIRTVPPGARLEWREDGPQLSGGRPIGQPGAMTRAAAIDGFISLFRLAIARRLPSQPFAMPLSGGRDSRHLLLALMEAGAAPDHCVTVGHFPPRGDDDSAIAARLCAHLGVPHVVLPQYEDRAATEREKNRRTHLLADEHSQFVALADYLRAATRETYDGIAGDVLSQSRYLNPDAHARFSSGNPTAAAQYVLDGYGNTVSESALRHLLSPEWLRRLTRERAVARLAAEIESHADAPNPVASFYFWNRTRREIALAPYGVMRDIDVHAPYLDRDLFDLLAALPASLLMDRQLHTDAIVRAYPSVAGIPYEAPRVANARGPQRRLAASLIGAVLSSPGVFRRGTLLPRLVATTVDGDAARLWHAALTLYLAQLTGVAARAT